MQVTNKIFKEFEESRKAQIQELFNFPKKEREEKQRLQKEKLRNIGIYF